MFKVTGNESFREGYALLAILNNPDFGKDADKKLLEEYTIEIKRELRKWAHRETAVDVGMGFMVERRVFGGDFDGYTELVTIPEVFDTEESADEFFNDFIKINYRPSMYDCTGQAFTSWYHLFKRNGRFYAYHRVAMDV